MTVQSHEPVAIIDGVVARGSEATVSVWDAGFTLGDGLFETIAVRGGRPIALAAHLERLRRGSIALGLSDLDSGLWLEDFETLMAAAPELCVGESVLRLQLTSGPFGLSATRVLTLRALDERALLRRHGLDLHTIVGARGVEGGLGGFKSTSWITSTVARRTHPSGEDPRFEGLFVTPEAQVLEGATTAICAHFSGCLVFPPLDGRILASTVRARLIAIAPALGLDVRVEPLALERLSLADDAFALNALLPIAPCLALDGEVLNSSALYPQLLHSLMAD